MLSPRRRCSPLGVVSSRWSLHVVVPPPVRSCFQFGRRSASMLVAVRIGVSSLVGVPRWSILASRRSSSCRRRVGLVGGVVDRLWSAIDQLVVRRRSSGPGCLPVAVGPPSQALPLPRSRCCLASSPGLVMALPQSSAGGRCLPVVGPCSSPHTPCLLCRSSRVLSIIISLIVVALSVSRLPHFPPPVSWLRPESFATRLSTELHLP